MRIYNEAKAAKKIRHQAMIITALLTTISLYILTIMLTQEPQEWIPDMVKEWWNIPALEPTPTERA